MVLYFHFTTGEKAEMIRRRHRIKAVKYESEPETAKFGDGVYFSKDEKAKSKGHDDFIVTVDIPEGDFRMTAFTNKGQEGFRFIGDVDLDEFPGWTIREPRSISASGGESNSLESLVMELEERIKESDGLAASLNSSLKVYF